MDMIMLDFARENIAFFGCFSPDISFCNIFVRYYFDFYKRMYFLI